MQNDNSHGRECAVPPAVSMKKLFYVGVAMLVLFELANVWFIMPLPYSQRVRSIDLAYALYSWRWLFRGAAVVVAIAGTRDAWRASALQRAMVLIAAIRTI